MNGGYSALRLFFRIEKLGRIPHVGNTGLTYITPVFERQHLLLQSVSIGKFQNDKTKAPLFSRYVAAGSRYFSSSVTTTDINKSDEARGADKKRPKTIETPKIKLISDTNVISVVTLEEAHKIAAKKGLHLSVVRLTKDSTTERPTYKLLTNTEFLALENPSTVVKNERDWDKDDKKKVKEAKNLVIKSKIAEHDVLSKINNMKRWIEKGYPIRLMIGQSGDKGDSETVYKLIEKGMKDTGVRFLQKVVKGDQIRVQLVPPKEQHPQQTKDSMKSDHEGIRDSR